MCCKKVISGNLLFPLARSASGPHFVNIKLVRLSVLVSGLVAPLDCVTRHFSGEGYASLLANTPHSNTLTSVIMRNTSRKEVDRPPDGLIYINNMTCEVGTHFLLYE